MIDTNNAMRRRIALIVFIVGCMLSVIAYRIFGPAIYPLYAITFPSCLLLLVVPLDSAFDAFSVLVFSSWLNGHLLGWLIWRFATIRKRQMTPPEPGQVSSEAALSATPKEPSA